MRSAFFLSLVATGSLVAQPTHLDTLAHLDIKPGGGYSALWGYTAPDGREYALIGLNGQGGQPAGTSIVEITNAPSIAEVAFIPGPASSWREMKTFRQYAFVVSEAGGGTQIIDLSQLPSAARLVKSFTYTTASGNTSRSHTISIHDGFMYLNGCASWSPGGVVIFDLRNDPENPVFAGEYQPDYIHDCYVVRDTMFASAIYSGGGLYIADVRQKNSVRFIGKISYSGSGTHNAWVTKDRRYAITTDEIGTTAKTLKFWDIRALPSLPTVPASTFTASPGQIEHNVTVRGDYAYVAWYSAGVRVVGIADPTQPVDAGGFDTSPSISGYNGVWGIYPYFPSGRVIAGDMQNGLWVFRFSDLPPRVPVRLIAPGDNALFTTGAPIPFRWSRTADPSKDPHRYLLHVTGAGLDTTYVADDSTFSFTHHQSLVAGATYTWQVSVQDEFNLTAGATTFHFTYDPGLPIQLSFFTAHEVGAGAVQLEWQTLSETNNFGFDVQRRAPSGSFASLPGSFIPGAGTTTVPHDYSFVDTTAEPGERFYRLRQTDLDGTEHYLEPLHITTSGPGQGGGLPSAFGLSQNFPNPFNPSTTFRYLLPAAGRVSLRIYDLFGQEVATLVDGRVEAGTHEARWVPTGVASGIYVARLLGDSFQQSRKLIYLR